ncbi:OmpH family outer membrane protein [uncultured Desulfovibrio sp.]|uniref:OmpH family outer membrane protein n=1 Tax=uncultured Desulfovibrio sp. TaxID=167968 RepID=UPI00260BBBD7|nr:OmpH family outer membrane protein [uncultured Desulfovibrio sp.]
MRIRLLVLSLLVLCLAVSGCQQPQEPAVKVAVVDMNRLLRDSEPGKEASRFLEGMQKEIQQQIDDVQARLGKDPENEALQRELQAIYMGGQQRINAEQQNVVSQLLDLTQRLVNNYRKANGLSVVLGSDVAVAYDPALDVTNALLDEMNKQKVNFVSVSNPQPAVPAAADAPAAAPAEAPAEAKAPAQEVQPAAPAAKAAEKPAEAQPAGKAAPAAEKPAAAKAPADSQTK